MTTVQPSRGVMPRTTQPVLLMNRSGATLAVGTTVGLDEATSRQSETTSHDIQATDSCWYNAVLPATASLHNRRYFIVTDLIGNAGADNKEFMAQEAGILQALVEGTDATAIGEPLFAKNANGELNSDNVAGGKVLGRALAVTAGSTAQLIEIKFDGLYGLGVSV